MKTIEVSITTGDIEMLDSILSIMVDHELDEYVDNWNEMENLKRIISDFTEAMEVKC